MKRKPAQYQPPRHDIRALSPHRFRAESVSEIGQTWKETKQESPAKLSHPMRVILFQHVVGVVAAQLEAMTGNQGNLQRPRTSVG